jgi:hypothetical protein
MSSVVELSRDGSLVDLEVDWEVVDIQKQFPLDQWVLDLVLQADQVASEECSVAALTVAEAEVDSEEASKTEEVMEEAEGEVLATKAATVEVIAEVKMVTLHPLLTLQLDQVVGEVVASVPGGMGAVGAILVLQNATVLACQRQVVGMTRVVAVAHMMTDPEDIVAATEGTVIAMDHLEVEVAATWSR